MIQEEVIDKIISSSGDIKGHHIIEIGPGNGALTEAILRENPLYLTSIEKDQRFLGKHSSLMKMFPNYKIIIDDVLQVNLAEIGSDCCQSPRKIIANIPYNISKDLISKIEYQYFTSITLMLQKEVALKLMEGSKLGFLTRLKVDVQYLFDVDKKCFSPEPNVQSAVVMLAPHKRYINVDHVYKIQKLVESLFNKKRKMLKSTLGDIFSNPNEILLLSDIDGSRRIQELSLEELSRIAEQI